MKPRGLAGGGFDGGDEIGIEPVAFAAQSGDGGCFLVGSGGNGACGGPGCFVAGLLPVEHEHGLAQAGELEGESRADDAAADDECVVTLHAEILPVNGAREDARRLERFQQVEGEQISFLGKILGAFPIRTLYRLLRLIEEAPNFIDHVFLSRVEIAAVSMM